jgi:hypothetical protein
MLPTVRLSKKQCPAAKATKLSKRLAASFSTLSQKEKFGESEN